MTTNETPEQFRARIAEIGFDGARLTEPDWLSVKIAVYTQALRDVLGVIDGWAATTHIQEAIKKFAAERGIDLTESEAQ